LVTEAFAVFAKDIRLELRSRHALNAILMFSVVSLTVVSFSVGQAELSSRLLGSLYWVIMFFSAVAGLSLVFIREEEAGTALILRLRADPAAILLGKLLFNLLLFSIVTVVVTTLFFLLTDASAEGLALFLLIVALGVISLCAATTLVAAIIARASSKGALFAVLSFPILILPLMMLVAASESALAGGAFAEISEPIQGLFAYSVVMITASFMLFRFVWLD